MKRVNKDYLAIYYGSIDDLRYLIDQKLLRINESYKPYAKEISVFVMPHAPNLFRYLIKKSKSKLIHLNKDHKINYNKENDVIVNTAPERSCNNCLEDHWPMQMQGPY